MTRSPVSSHSDESGAGLVALLDNMDVELGAVPTDIQSWADSVVGLVKDDAQ